MLLVGVGRHKRRVIIKITKKISNFIFLTLFWGRGLKMHPSTHLKFKKYCGPTIIFNHLPLPII